MLKSMTGYGKAVAEGGSLCVSVEIKTVNHRYCDIGLKAPRSLMAYENDIRKQVSQSLKRGKVDLFISIDQPGEAAAVPGVNTLLAERYLELFKGLSQQYGLGSEIPLELLVSQKDVLTLQEQSLDDQALLSCLKEALAEALKAVTLMRSREGEATREDMDARVSGVEDLLKAVMERSPLVVGEWRERLHERLCRLGDEIEIDPQRVAQEITLFTDRCDISEEIARFQSHVVQFRDLYESQEPVGRQMDFLLQEFNREVNTMGSKANDAQLSRLVVSLKSELEKIREQVQNIE